jgi:hypothetical protein
VPYHFAGAAHALHAEPSDAAAGELGQHLLLAALIKAVE